MDLKHVSDIPEYDSRVADIMLSISMERPGNPMESQSKRVVPQYLAEQKIPTSVEEFLKMEGLDDWPEHITSEYPIEHDSQSVFGDLDQITDFLKSAAPLHEQLASLDALENRINSLESSLNKYADAILTDETRFSRIKKGIFYSNVDKLFETEVDHLGGQLQSKGGQSQGKATMNRHVIVAGQLQDKKKKDVNFTNFPGYRAKELAELPGQLEAPQLLHRVTQAQDFDTGFAKFWKKIFLSEASIAVVHDLFWWTFMKIFKPGTQTDQDQVFDRLADSFAALFFSIHPDTRDKIFKVYPGVLAQAIYMIFHDAFPESHRMFGPLFKEEVVGYCWELTTGTKPPPRTWNEWDLEGLQGKSGENFDSKQLAIMPGNTELEAPKFDFDGLYKSIESLETQVVNGEVVPVVYEELTKHNLPVKRVVESSLVGPGPEYSKAVFNLSGLSPLMAHFLNMKHLRDAAIVGRKVRRTEIKGQPTGERTFQDIIEEKRALTKSNKAHYIKLCKETEAELSKIEKRRAMVTKEINKLKDNTAAFKQTGLDVKFVADRLMSKINGDPKRVPENLVTANGEVSVERSSDSEESDEELEETIALEE